VKNWQVYYPLFFLGLLGLTIGLYLPGLDGVFLVDDAVNLEPLNHNGGVTSANNFLAFVFGNHSGMLGRPISMLSFLIDDQHFPGSVGNYRYTNLMIHCLGGVVLFALSRRLVLHSTVKGEKFATELALLVAGLWLLAPLHVSTTLYVIQRMTQLSTLFCLAGLYLYIVGRQQIMVGRSTGRIWILVGLYFFGLLATLSKENGILILCFALVFELTIASSRNESENRFVIYVISLPMMFGLAYLLSKFSSFTNSSYRDFTILERLLTESRIVWDYVGKLVFPFGTKMGLVHDDITISSGVLSPLWTSFALLAHLLVLGAAVFYRGRWPWFFFTVFGFYSGHLLESTFIPLELYFEHRNYMPSIFIFTGMAMLCWNDSAQRKAPKYVIIFLIILSAVVTLQRTKIWGNPIAQANVWAMEHPLSLRAQTGLVVAHLSQRKYADAEKVLQQSRLLWPRAIHLDFLLLNEACRGNMALNIGIDEFVDKIAAGKYNGFLPSTFKSTYILYAERKCSVISGDLMVRIFERMYAIEGMPRTYLSSVSMLEFDFHGTAGHLSLTIAALERTLGYKKDGFVFYLKSAIFNSAGLPELALEAIEQAIDIERNKVFFLQNKLAQYELFRESILASRKWEMPEKSNKIL